MGSPVLRKNWLMVSLAASVVLGVTAVLWSQSAGHDQLYGVLSNAGLVQAVEALDSLGIDYKFEKRTGAITVARGKVHEARLKLATMGLPKGGESGIELLEKNQGFGTNRFMETARYRQALEGELDSAEIEKTAESFVSGNAAVRSEETIKEQTAQMNSGVMPGVRASKPPPAEVAGPSAKAKDLPVKNSRQATRNDEFDRSIANTCSGPAAVRRLSTEVVVDDHTRINDVGEIERTPLKTEELTRLAALVKEAVGFDEKRNDNVNVYNISFKAVDEVGPISDQPVWKQAWLWKVGKQAFGELLVLLLAFGILRPAIRNLVAKAPPPVLPDRGSAGQLRLGDD